MQPSSLWPVPQQASHQPNQYPPPPPRPACPALPCRSNWGNWVVAAGLTGGRVNKFNITKQSNVGVLLFSSLFFSLL